MHFPLVIELHRSDNMWSDDLLLEEAEARTLEIRAQLLHPTPGAEVGEKEMSIETEDSLD
jgi:hypothetical protein